MSRRQRLHGVPSGSDLNAYNIGVLSESRIFIAMRDCSMDKMRDINANSLSQLHDQLRKFDISVRSRSEGRKTEHTEQWCICRLLATMSEHQELHYPVCMHHRDPDRPDFEIKSGENVIGIEVTEAVPQNLTSTDALAEQEGIDGVLDLSKYNLGDDKKPAKELRNILANDERGPGWGDNGPEKGWARDIWLKCKEKTSKLRDPGFTMFPENWLLIRDELPYIVRKPEVARPLLSDHLKPYWNETGVFNAIVVDCGQEIIKVTPRDTCSWNVCDLWPNV